MHSTQYDDIYLTLDKKINFTDILRNVISSISAHLCKTFATGGRTKIHQKILRSPKWRTWTSFETGKIIHTFQSKLMKTL